MGANLSGKAVIAGIGATRIRRAARPHDDLDECRGNPQGTERRRHREGRGRRTLREVSDLEIRNDVRAEDCRSDRPPAEDRRRMGFGRLVQRHHDLAGNHGDRSRPVRDCRGHLCRQSEDRIRGKLQSPARRRRALRLVCGVVFLCDDRAPPHGRARHAARGVGRGGCGRSAPWSAKSECAVAQAARARRVHGHAADGRAVLPRRLHTRLGRRSRRRGDEYGTGQEDGRARNRCPSWASDLAKRRGT